MALPRPTSDTVPVAVRVRFRDARLRVWLITLAPVVVFLLTVALASELTARVVNCDLAADCTPHIPAVKAIPLENAPMLPFSELRGRLTWCLSVLAVAVTVSLLLGATLETMGVVRRPRIRVLLRTCTVGAVLLLGLRGMDGTYAFNEAFLGETVYSLTPSTRLGVAFAEGMGHAALLGLVLSVAAVLYAAARSVHLDAPVESARAAEELSVHQRRMNTLLNLGALALVAGTLESSALYSWANTMFLPADIYFGKDGTNDLPAAMGLLTGAFYSLFLTAVFAPGFGLLRRMANQLAVAANPDATVSDRQTWLEKHALDASLPKHLVSALAVLAPTIAGGPLVAFFQALLESA